MSRRLILLRHGRTAWNAERRFQGQADPPLDDVGRAQAYEVAGILAALRPDLIVTSDLQRAAATADVVAAVCGLPVAVHEGFRERHLGHWQRLTREQVQEQYPAEFALWVAGADVDERGGETRDAVAERSVAALAAQPVVPLTVVVTHSATAMALTNALIELPQTVHPLGPLANCHWVELFTEARADGGADRWRVRGHNLGAPGVVVPVPLTGDVADDAADADA